MTAFVGTHWSATLLVTEGFSFVIVFRVFDIGSDMAMLCESDERVVEADRVAVLDVDRRVTTTH